MYCKKCGKFIGIDADYCDECKRAEESASSAAYRSNDPYNRDFYNPPIVMQDSSAIGLGKAIASAVLSMIGFIFVYAGLIAIWDPATAIVCMFIGAIPTLLGFIFGVLSIVDFRRTRHIRSGKRIPLLILGIVSVIEACSSMFIGFILILLIGMV